MIRTIVRLAICCSVILAVGRASADPGRVLRVGTHDSPPFVIKKGDQWSGIAIELLRSIATEMGATLDIHDLEPAQLVAGTATDIDVVATLGVSEKMDARYDLSHVWYASGFAIAVPEPKKESAITMIARIFSGTFVLIVIGMFGVLTLVGLLMFWFERRHVEPLPKEKQALSKALFWAFEPVIGYKASQHTTRAGRILGTVWGLFGVVLVSGLTANLAAQLTARRMATTVKGPEDLPRVRVGVVEHTAGRTFCDRRGIARVEFPSLDQALTALDEHKLDAVLDDAPNLAFALKRGHDHLVVLPGTFANHNYAFGLQQDSPLRKELNAALLKAITADSWPSLLASYLGKVD